MNHAINYDPMARTVSNTSTATKEPTLFDHPAPQAQPKPPRLVFGGHVPYQRKSETSRQAAKSMESATAPLRVKLLEFIRSRGDLGATHAECSAYYAGMQGKSEDSDTCRNTAGPRVTELKDAGFVADSGRRRPTRPGSNKTCTVWVATAKEGDGSVCERIPQ